MPQCVTSPPLTLTLLQVMAQINPRQVQHLKKMQPLFRFEHRNIAQTNGYAAAAAAAAHMNDPAPPLVAPIPDPIPDPVSAGTVPPLPIPGG
jgi:hypothetical protein